MNGSKYFEHIATTEEIGLRLDTFISGIDDITRSSAQKLIAEGNVTIDGNKNVKKNYKIKEGDVIALQIPGLKELKIDAEDISLNIVYEDSEIIIIDKPQGMVVHPAPGHYTGTVVNGLLFHCREGLSGINGVLRPGIVHRIDKDTSGVIVCAKTNNAHVNLSAQFEVHSIRRVYNGICFGVLKEDSAKIDAPIARNKIDRKKMAVNFQNGKVAVTYYNVIERFQKYTFFKAELETGRTHQIRVHMAHIGHPILGDCTYTKRSQPHNLNGQALHAKTLGFLHPKTGKYIEFTSELPDYFERLLTIIV